MAPHTLKTLNHRSKKSGVKNFSAAILFNKSKDKLFGTGVSKDNQNIHNYIKELLFDLKHCRNNAEINNLKIEINEAYKHSDSKLDV
ncbi:hypothetical protein [Francisella adeliensis]|uniref:Uncharacterized protein n=1 Tax=Francisella adeliensis TaxID=2007306 RepID=A0A2Z4Y0V7_9GAMM|nr:hypothetical protein [Francisella adeliensis]AXA34569.1 hypothetical protein CDH04_09255 [Francisella adeliensis]MBK2086293.1 hypothetical protein [Francisella adeliensis]MBK2096509.1 hypothetical protein [Francisella adeliensis]QIW12815.1 hypothetical protein FZC43_09270 [Francisella adeliensis]QIW14692.1 hypothetical protein FZC44_09260 [Francisella adeliensis]